jgi:UDP-3-O-[3-hydroxymyristoyl] N-acetylglucosamine deacetylase/3-hydroxyacyl-[acyl-carrier-protein] dehydratase
VKFIDSITVDAGRGAAEGSLFVDGAADYLRDHFPGAPTLPGLVMLEAAVRTAAALWEAGAGPTGGSVLTHVDRLQLVRRVVPGETFLVRAERLAGPDETGTAAFAAQGAVGGETAMRARFRLRVAGARHANAIEEVTR